jgi:hypothetical protein
MNRRLVAAIALALMPVASTEAQQTQPPPLLLVPGSTRGMGLGNAYVAGSGADVIFYNPAQVGESRTTVVSTQRFGSAATLASLATNTAALGLSVGFGVQYIEYGAEQPDGATTIGRLARGGDFAASSVLGLMSLSKEQNGVRIGVTAKYLAQQVAAGRQSTPTFDIGFATDVRFIALGLVLSDPDGVFDNGSTPALRLPTRATLGAMITGRPISTWFDAGIAASVSTDKRGRLLPAGGVELSYVPVSGWSFTGRVGAQAAAKPEYDGASALTLGASINADRLSLDYAFQQLQGEGAAHRVGVRIR